MVSSASASVAATAPPSWDGHAEGATCDERIADWHKHAEACAIDVRRLNQIPGWPALSTEDRQAVPSGHELFVDRAGRVFDSARDEVTDPATAVNALGARTTPRVWILPTPDADLATVVEIATRVRRRDKEAFLIAASTTTPGSTKSPRTAALLDGAPTSTEVAMRIAKALPSALVGCSTTEERLRGLVNETHRDRAMLNALTEGLSTDQCACDADTALELGAWILFGGLPAVGKPFVVALSEEGPSIRVIRPRTIADLYRDLPNDGELVRVVLP